MPPGEKTYIFPENYGLSVKMQRGHGRVAITPILATIILIAVTLVAGIAIAAFVFNLFGIFGNPPQISYNSAITLKISSGTLATPGAIAATCAASSTPGQSLEFTNIGTGTGTIRSVTISSNAGGGPVPVTGVECTLIAGATKYITFTAVGPGTAFAGDTFSGFATLTGGQSISFANTFN
ncbi:MAG: hypothetical protein HY296_00345 [Thaumarchaeota archaeon]|nr:hypothetical protein [Nitrososphaerota archaeon]